MLIITGATTGKLGTNNTAIKNIKRTARGYRNAANYKSVYSLEECRPDAAGRSFQGFISPRIVKSP